MVSTLYAPRVSLTRTDDDHRFVWFARSKVSRKRGSNRLGPPRKGSLALRGVDVTRPVELGEPFFPPLAPPLVLARRTNASGRLAH